MKTQIPFVVPNPPVAIPATREQLLSWGIPEADIDKGESRGQIETRGAWQIPVSYRALCESAKWDKSKGYTVRTEATIFGMRTLCNARESAGFQLEGRVAVNGRKVRGFTSSQMFELPDGKLVNVATIFACLGEDK